MKGRKGTSELTLRVDLSPDVGVELDQEPLVEILQRGLELEGPEGPTEISILVADDETLRSLNARFRGIDAPTDVLSFPARGPTPSRQTDHALGWFATADEQRHLGDIAVSYPAAVRQAQERGWSVQEELRFLLVHGLLHLLGYEHDTPRGRAAMSQREEKILG